MLAGGCLCGQVRYEAGGEPFLESICHCADCRRAVGAASVAWFTVKQADLRWIGAPPARFRSSPSASRGFCPRCGTSLSFEGDAKPDEIDLATATLDDPAQAAPKDHLFTASAVAWDKICDGLPAYPRRRQDGPG
jgi:hypothetical protein